MCYALYLGTNLPLRIGEFNQFKPRLYFQTLSFREMPVLSLFRSKFIYYAGSWHGCGCGWLVNEEVLLTKEDRLELELSYQCIASLKRLIEKILLTQPVVELFLCYEESQGRPPKRVRMVTVNDLFQNKKLLIEELDFVAVTRDSYSRTV